MLILTHSVSLLALLLPSGGAGGLNPLRAPEGEAEGKAGGEAVCRSKAFSKRASASGENCRSEAETTTSAMPSTQGWSVSENRSVSWCLMPFFTFSLHFDLHCHKLLKTLVIIEEWGFKFSCQKRFKKFKFFKFLDFSQCQPASKFKFFTPSMTRI